MFERRRQNSLLTSGCNQKAAASNMHCIILLYLAGCCIFGLQPINFVVIPIMQCQTHSNILFCTLSLHDIAHYFCLLLYLLYIFFHIVQG